LYFETMLPLLAWGAAVAILSIGPMRRTADLATAMGFAVLAFLIQDSINFASFVPGTLTTALACFAVAIAARRADETSDTTKQRAAPARFTTAAVAALIAIVALTGVGLAPVWRADAALARARHATSAQNALLAYDEASRADPWDPTAPFEASRLLRALARRQPNDGTCELAVKQAQTAVDRDPQNVQVHRELCRAYALRAESTGRKEDYDAAIAAAETAASLYPTDPATQVMLADRLAARGRRFSSDDDLAQAVSHYQSALHIDDRRPQWERIRRLSAKQRSEIQQKIHQISPESQSE
jgi:tetratricopeptide (TPR) repeat protein